MYITDAAKRVFKKFTIPWFNKNGFEGSVEDLKKALINLIKYYLPAEPFLKNYEKLFRKLKCI